MSDHTSEMLDWQQVLGNDGAAFGRLFDRHHERVFRHASRLVDTREDAEDILAVAFLELWRRRKRVRLVNGSPIAWLLATTTNVALNQRRAGRRYRAFLARLPREAAAADAATESLQVIEIDVDPRLLAEIRRLSDEDQRLVALVALEGFSLSEAGAALGISGAAARSRWQRTRSRLAERMPTHADLIADTTGGDR